MLENWLRKKNENKLRYCIQNFEIGSKFSTHLLFVEFESVFAPCTAVSSMLSLNSGASPLLLLLLAIFSFCILGAIILAKTYRHTDDTLMRIVLRITVELSVTIVLFIDNNNTLKPYQGYDDETTAIYDHAGHYINVVVTYIVITSGVIVIDSS